MIAVSRRDGRALLLGATIVAMGLLVVRGIPFARSAYSGELARARELHVRADAVNAAVASRPRLEDSLARARDRWKVERSRLFQARSLNGGAAASSAWFARAARSSEVQISSIQVRADSTARGGFRQVEIAATARTDITGLMAFLSVLETGGRRFRIVKMTVARSGVAAVGDVAETLSVDLVARTVVEETAR